MRGLPKGYKFKSYTCPECGKTFKSNHITKHLKSGHKSPLTAEVDTKKVTTVEMYMADLEKSIESAIKSIDALRNRLSIVMGPPDSKKEEPEFFPDGASPLVLFLQKEIARTGLVLKSIDDISHRLQV